MEYARNYPCFYGAKGHSKDINPKTNTLTDIIKIGTSNHIAARKSGYFQTWIAPALSIARLAALN